MAWGRSGTGDYNLWRGEKYLPGVWVALRELRCMGCLLPVDVWNWGGRRCRWRGASGQRLQAEPEVFLVDATRVRERYPVRIRNGWEINVYAVQHSRFREVLLLDAYNVPVAEPCFFIDITEVRRLGFLPENSEILQIRRNAGLHFTNLLLGSTRTDPGSKFPTLTPSHAA